MFNGRKVNVVLLNNARVQRIKVHDEDKLVPKTPLGIKNQASFVFVPLAFGLLASLTFLLVFDFGKGCSFFAPLFVGRDVLETVELMKQDVFVTFRTTTVECLIPRSIGEFEVTGISDEGTLP